MRYLKLEKGLYDFNLISHFTSKDWKYEINIKQKISSNLFLKKVNIL